jgi:hypothetical protein
MNIRHGMWALLALLALMCMQGGGAKPVESDPGKKSVPRSIALIGDSRMFDMQFMNYGSYSNYLAADHKKYPLFAQTSFTFCDDNPATSQSVPGSDYYNSIANDARRAALNFPYVLAKGHDGVIISLGINSTGMVEDTIANLKKMCAMAKEKNMFVALMTIAPWQRYETWGQFYQYGTETINNWILSRPENVDVVINTYALLGDPAAPMAMRPDYTGDGAHLMPLAHEVMAAEVNRVFSEYFGVKTVSR